MRKLGRAAEKGRKRFLRWMKLFVPGRLYDIEGELVRCSEKTEGTVSFGKLAGRDGDPVCGEAGRMSVVRRRGLARTVRAPARCRTARARIGGRACEGRASVCRGGVEVSRISGTSERGMTYMDSRLLPG